MGGGFGGKETRSVFASCAAAVAAKISGRPVRLTLARDVDMSITGTRHVFVTKYHASARIRETGPKLEALDIQLYANAGCAFDLSGPVVDRALFHVDGCYFFPNFRAVGVACKTVQPPHTAFRGFGGPQVGPLIFQYLLALLIISFYRPSF
jgi:xanthine dehydrogenase/oxidase